MSLSIVIMAAGKGTRMKSSRPKVLHKLAGQPMLAHVVHTTASLKADQQVVITGHGADMVEAEMRQAFGPDALQFVRQMPQLGTGHAVQQAVPVLPDEGITLILNGDTPLIKASTAQALVDACAGQQLALLTITLDDATGYGRIVRDEAGQQVLAIVEHKDATPEQRQIREVYTGVMAAPTARLKHWLSQLKNDNAQGEFYLTDVVAMAQAEGLHVVAAQASAEIEVLGVNSPLQLADLERRFQLSQAQALMEQGVRLADPARFDVRGSLQCGTDVDIDVNCVFEGQVTLGDEVSIGPHCVIRNAHIGKGTRIAAFTHIEGDQAGVQVGQNVQIGPFARLRPGAQLADDVHIGNFVEVKNSSMAKGAKANHLAYLGDATVGERVNYGAGSITANYDGANKHRTVLGNDVHVGSNCVLIAPVKVGDGATVGGGSTITKDVAAGELAVARSRQSSLGAWKRPQKLKP
jgi:bifunctional UDP-N-acetylglucosamine pyrophosphorylase/glucosamine-1-phosphate N-acetyltransferase